MNTSKTPKRLIWGTIIALAVVLAGFSLTYLTWRAQQVESLTDQSLLTGTPCTAPCWQGIVPGSTTSSQALVILENNVYVNKGSLRAGSTGNSGRVTWSYSMPGSYGDNWITWEDGVVQDIALLSNCDVTLGEMIDKFGTPEALMASGCPLAQSCWKIDLFYPEIGMSVGVSVEFDVPQIGPAMSIEGVSLFVPQSVEERFAYIHRYHHSEGKEETIAQMNELIRPWQGYGGLFEVYYTSPQDLDLSE